VGLFNGSAWTYSGYHSGSGNYETLTVSGITAGGTQAVANAFFAGSCTAYLDNAMLVVGSVAADYAPFLPADDLARCQRYYEIIEQASVYLSGYHVASGGLQWPISWHVTKAIVPTVTKNGTWAVANTAQPVLSGPGLSGCGIGLTATGTGNTATNNGGAGNTITAESNV
jgi:hypothetical protein